MVSPRGLIGLGMATQLAKRLGIASGTADANLNGGASFAAATAIGQFQFYVRANAQSSANVFQMPNTAEIGSEYTIFNTGSVAGSIYPPTITGGTGVFNVNGGATATLTSIATGKGVFLVAVTASTFDAFLSS
jgi:hypothetical protein